MDTNHLALGIDYVIPGNDDSAKAVALYARAFADAVLEGRDHATADDAWRLGPGWRKEFRRGPEECLSASLHCYIKGGLSPAPLSNLIPLRETHGCTTASMVAELRACTDAPMMECKKALTRCVCVCAEMVVQRRSGSRKRSLRRQAGQQGRQGRIRAITAEGTVASGRRWRHGVAGSEVNCRDRLRFRERCFQSAFRGRTGWSSWPSTTLSTYSGTMPAPCRLSQEGFGRDGWVTCARA